MAAPHAAYPTAFDEDVTAAPGAAQESDALMTDDTGRHLSKRGPAGGPPGSVVTLCCVAALISIVSFFVSSSWQDVPDSNSGLCVGDLIYSKCVTPCGSSCSAILDNDCSHPCWPGCMCPTDKPVFVSNGTCVASLAQCPLPTGSPTSLATAQPTPPHTNPPSYLKTWSVVNADDASDFSSCSKFPAPSLVSPGATLAWPSEWKMNLVRVGISPCPTGSDASLYYAIVSKQACGQGGLPVKTFYTQVASNRSSESVPGIEYYCHAMQKEFVRFYFSRLSNLGAGKRYEYVIGVENASVSTPPVRHVFTAPLLPGDASSTMNQAFVMGDSGFRNAKDNGFASMHAFNDQVGLFLHVGDLSYVTNNGACWGGNVFGEPVGPCGWNCTEKCIYNGRFNDFSSYLNWAGTVDQSLGGRIVWMTTMGNHDNDPGWFFVNRPPLMAALPGVSPPQFPFRLDGMEAFKPLVEAKLMDHVAAYLREPFFYSFDYGLAHVLVYGAEDNPNNGYERWDGKPLSPMMLERFHKHFGVDSAQYAFIKADLMRASAPAQRAKVPWILVMSHRPMYHTAKHHPNCGGGGDWSICMIRDLYEPLFHQYGVDVFFSGHSHHYQRTVPIYKSVAHANGTVHIIVGTGGFELLGEHWGSNPPWIASRHSSKFGYGHYSIANATHMKWQHLAFINSTVIDSAWIVRGI